MGPRRRASAVEDWPEAMATVLSCTYTVRAGRAIAFGLPSRKHFRITYNYFAEGQLHTGELFSEKPMAQGSLFPLRYEPGQPHGNPQVITTRAPLLAFGVAGSIMLSLAWLLLIRGCS